MDLSQLAPPAGSRKKKKRVGRGNGSGHGGTACKGHKGQNSRSGGGVRDGFEGGQMPLTRRLPKRGFRSRLCKDIATLNLDKLNVFETGMVIDVDQLRKSGLIKNSAKNVKILGCGEVDHPLTVKIAMISTGARTKIEAAGGSVIEVV
ncbi:MAG: 50S ribosomal protein L15 [Syntrophus sp. PtaU1.Bin005]|jgi:large subunit ribosomal protein L15|uniref:50S ribosomal protein L15 n=1 Tax=Syntrophus TaxID=43773 RepID=UPI0009C69C9D|nr:MAG: 50S ribosomal protein L15 [Syntrophus sp. PtaB.Bin138]OPY81544.1 MAG: 50S ribosomal protein L15 [Syntrophus sp. PtaU1.Bin005]